MLNSFATLRFHELAEVLTEHDGVSVGRQFGRDCLKYGKHAFIVLDSKVLAFRTGPDSQKLTEAIPGAWLWNPKDHPRPKQSWIACLPHDAEQISSLALFAFDWVRS